MKRIGLISDTHGLMRPQALAALAGCESIVHAGDIGAAAILDALAAIAPVTAVRGNNDTAAWAAAIPERATLDLGAAGVLLVLHDLAALDDAPRPPRLRVVVTGHSHQPKVFERDGVLFVNPGSAGPRRFKLPVTVAYLDIRAGRVRAELATIL